MKASLLSPLPKGLAWSGHLAVLQLQAFLALVPTFPHKFLLDTGLNQGRKDHWLSLGLSQQQVLSGSTFLCAGHVSHFLPLCHRELVLQVKLQSPGRKSSCQNIQVLCCAPPNAEALTLKEELGKAGREAGVGGSKTKFFPICHFVRE